MTWHLTPWIAERCPTVHAADEAHLGVDGAREDVAVTALPLPDPSLHDVYEVELATGKATKIFENPGYVNPIADEELHLRFAQKFEPDGSIQFGCAYEAGSMLDQATVAGQAMACSIQCRNFPALAALPVVRQWAGVVVQTPDALPVIDADTGLDGLVINSGHFFGNLAGAFSGSLVAQIVEGRTPSYPVDGFSRRRFAS